MDSVSWVDLASTLATIAAAIGAYLVYLKGQNDEKRSAAIIIIMDIRHAENIVSNLKESNIVLRNMKNILSSNNWDKYKHLFARDLSYDDFSNFNTFFSSCMEISDAKGRLLTVFLANLTEKARIGQERVIDQSIKMKRKYKNIPDPELNFVDPGDMDLIINSVNNETWEFDPREPRDLIAKHIENIPRLSTTTAFEKLKKIAEIP